ncbi:hypothetical protein BUH_6013 [Burkholderia pseudomallei Pakistan 9]|nr:hypothetical protein BUH_6013 [Burkholderia pseudomallei Pakistan 9]
MQRRMDEANCVTQNSVDFRRAGCRAGTSCGSIIPQSFAA